MQPQSVCISGGWSSSTSPSSSIRRMDVESRRRTSQLRLPSAPDRRAALHSLLSDVKSSSSSAGLQEAAAPALVRGQKSCLTPHRPSEEGQHCSQDPNPHPAPSHSEGEHPARSFQAVKTRNKSPAGFAASASRTCCFI